MKGKAKYKNAIKVNNKLVQIKLLQKKMFILPSYLAVKCCALVVTPSTVRIQNRDTSSKQEKIQTIYLSIVTSTY